MTDKEPEALRADLLAMFNSASPKDREIMANLIANYVLLDPESHPLAVSVSEVILEAEELRRAGRLQEAVYHLEKALKKS